jgi:SAM-dependent methyltransferase
MSPRRSKALVEPQNAPPGWLLPLLGAAGVAGNQPFDTNGTRFVMRGGIPRQVCKLSDEQGQTAETFGFKWRKDDLFDQKEYLAQVRSWMLERYGDVEHAHWWEDYGPAPLILDAGCGAALTAIEMFGDRLKSARYLGADVSTAVDVARARFGARGYGGGFIQCDLNSLPLADGSVDIAFSEGVLHHTDSTADAFAAVARLIKPGGRFLFYVYAKKGPVREFTDDHIRHQLQSMTAEEAWQAVLPLTRLGEALGNLTIEIDVPEDIAVLGIPKGRIDLQRLFYWHVCKAFYRPDWTIEQMNSINYDWFAPANAHRHTPEEVRGWCADARLTVEREIVEEAGITVIARKDA